MIKANVVAPLFLAHLPKSGIPLIENWPTEVNECNRDISTVSLLPVLRKLATRGMINSDLPVLFRHQVQALGGQLSYSDRHMVLPVETSGRLGMG